MGWVLLPILAKQVRLPRLAQHVSHLSYLMVKVQQSLHLPIAVYYCCLSLLNAVQRSCMTAVTPFDAAVSGEGAACCTFG